MDLSIVLSGEAGQGVQTIEHLLTRIIKNCGYYVFATKEYMSRIRGGNNTIEIRVSSKPVTAFVDKIDIVIPLNTEALTRINSRFTKETHILGEKNSIQSEDKGKADIIDLSLAQMAFDVGNKVYANTVAVGLISGILNLELETIKKFIKSFFKHKKDSIINNNISAVELGFNKGLEFCESGKLNVKIKSSEKVKKDILINGSEAVAMGALAGGCNFISAYPMSPSTGVLVFLAQHASEYGIIAEQAEDEIAAVNMALGAWYAGARALVTTSGGGFALMSEGISLSGMIETPVVIHLAQRPGPATGLPTRTEQGDLELAIHSGHGEFPRIVLAPGHIEETFSLTRQAFTLADKFQLPVTILTDQYLMDTYYNVSCLDLSSSKDEKYIIKTDKKYKRYQITKDGISPRGIPGYGDGFVVVDSDEHDETGHITEDLQLRERINEKRLNKYKSIEKESIKPELIGAKEYKTLLVGWGSTYHIIKEALCELNKKDTAFLHLKQVYPLTSTLIPYFNKAKKIIMIENNATSQMGQLIKKTFGIDIEHKILKYNGLPFSVEEVRDKVLEILNKKDKK